MASFQPVRRWMRSNLISKRKVVIRGHKDPSRAHLAAQGKQCDGVCSPAELPSRMQHNSSANNTRPGGKLLSVILRVHAAISVSFPEKPYIRGLEQVLFLPVALIRSHKSSSCVTVYIPLRRPALLQIRG